MKRSRITGMLAVVAAAVALTAVSCQKGKADQPSPAAGEKVSISISGDFTDLTETGDTKASVQSIFRMTWAGGEKVYVYGTTDGTNITSLGTLTAALVDGTDGREAELSGTITAPANDTKLTLVYSPKFSSAPALSSGAISVDLSSQTGEADEVTFVAYATVPYNGSTTSSYRTSFKFATSVLRVNASNLAASTALTSATVGEIETTCQLTFKVYDEPDVTGVTAGTITRTLTSCSANANGCLAFYVAVPAITANANRTLSVTRSANEGKDVDSYGGVNAVATGSKGAGSLMNSIAPMELLRGKINDQEYVPIKGSDGKYLKWATQNLAVTESGKAKWNGTNYQIGDYFQWAASYAGYGIEEDADKKPGNLVIYTSFTNTCAGGDSDAFTFKDSKSFDITLAPYGGNSYTKYTGTGDGKDGKTKLEPSDDVANIVLGGTWRLPMGGSAGEFSKMYTVTYWAWDATDEGYYVFQPGVGTSGTAGERGDIAETDDKTKALLFFPAAGFGANADLSEAGDSGRYWSSTLTSVSTYYAYCLYFYSLDVLLDDYFDRHLGFSVRPVSD